MKTASVPSSPVRSHGMIVALAVFCVGWGTNVATPFLVRYRERLDLGDSATVSIFTVYVLGILCSLLVAGPVSDRIGRRRLVVPFMVISALASLLLIGGRDSFALLMVGRLGLGIVSGATFGVAAAWLQELLGPGGERRAALVMTAVTYFGFGFGPITSAVIDRLTDHGLVIPFVIHAAITLVVVPLVLRVPETVGGTVARRTGPVRIELGVPPHLRRFFLLAVIPLGIWVFSYPSTGFALFPVFIADAADLDSTGAAVMIAGVAGTLTAWSGLLSRPLIARLGERRGLWVGLGAGTLGFMFGTLGLILDSWLALVPGSMLLGAASGTISASLLAMVATVAEPTTRGALNSTMYVVAYFGMGMPTFITTLGRGLSLEGALVVVTVLSAVACAWAIRLDVTDGWQHMAASDAATEVTPV